MIGSCSIVIRAYNEEKYLGRLLEGIQNQTIKDVEIIVVDSGSTDKTISIAESYGAVVERISPHKFTFGRSLNLGIRRASREYVVIVSAHVYPVYPDWLEALLKPFIDENVALVYGKQRGPGSAKFSEQRIYQQWYPEVSSMQQSSPFCNNANAAIRRSLWEDTPYDEMLTGLEDLAWAKWAIGKGHTVAYVAEAEIIHIHNETPRGVFNRYRREGMAFKRIFPESHFSIYDFLYLVVTNIVSDLWHALLERRILENSLSILWFRTMQFWGTYQGYRKSGPVTAHLRQTFYYPHWNTVNNDERDIEPIRYNQ